MIRVEPFGPVVKFQLARALLGRPLYFTAAYWVNGLLVDTGCAHTEGELMQALAGRQVECAVNTHYHEDHIGANAALQAQGVDILAHPLALPVLADPRGQQPLHLYRRVFWGYPRPSRGRPIGERVETEHYRFQVIHTPGHSPDHVCLYEPDEGWLFTGDAYIGGRDRALRGGYDIWGIIASLKKLAALDITRLFPGSGSVRDDPGYRLREKIAYLEEAGQRVRELHRRGWNVNRIRREVFGPEPVLAYVTLGHFTGKRLVRSYLEEGS